MSPAPSPPSSEKVDFSLSLFFLLIFTFFSPDPLFVFAFIVINFSPISSRPVARSFLHDSE